MKSRWICRMCTSYALAAAGYLAMGALYLLAGLLRGIGFLCRKGRRGLELLLGKTREVLLPLKKRGTALLARLRAGLLTRGKALASVWAFRRELCRELQEDNPGEGLPLLLPGPVEEA